MEPSTPTAAAPRPGPTEPAVAVHAVLVTYRRPHAVAEHLAVLAEQTRLPDTLVVVDNGADPVVREVVARSGFDERYVAAPDNLGPAGGYALGMRLAAAGADEGDWLLLLDDDDPPPRTTSIADLVAFAVAQQAADPRVGAVGTVGARFDRRAGRTRRLADADLHGAVDVDHLGGNHLPLVAVRAVRDVGPYRAELFFGFEELEFGLRLRRSGWRVVVDGDAHRANRAAAGRLGTPPPSPPPVPWRQYYSQRNLVHLLREQGHTLAALRVTAERGVAKPIVVLTRQRGPRNRRVAWFLARGTVDAWRGRLGQRVRPEPKPATVGQRSAG